jgi:hypothetical protein
MSKQILKNLENVKPGDLICVDWLDASRGRIETMRQLREVGSPGAVIDSPVKSYGVFIGLFGKRSKHIVLVASLWVFTAVADYGQVDSTIIPVGCVETVHTIQGEVLDLERVKLCMSAFLQGRCYHYHRRFLFGERTFEVNKPNAEKD